MLTMLKVVNVYHESANLFGRAVSCFWEDKTYRIVVDIAGVQKGICYLASLQYAT